MDNSLINEQQQYYNKRSKEYDQWWLRENDFDQGTFLNNEFHNNKKPIYEHIKSITISGKPEGSKLKVLELAPGTGNWTELFLTYPEHFQIRCEEGSPDMVEVLKFKYGSLIKQFAPEDFQINITNLLSDEFQPSSNTYDIVFLGFFISHIPPELFQTFFTKIFNSLKVGGKIVFADSYYPTRYKTKAHESAINRINYNPNVESDYAIERKLISGEKYRIVKIGFSTEDIISILNNVGFIMERGDICSVNSTFIFGSFSKPSSDQ